jgi:hypothetical protein
MLEEKPRGHCRLVSQPGLDFELAPPGQEEQTALRTYEIDRDGHQRLDESAGFYLARSPAAQRVCL